MKSNSEWSPSKIHKKLRSELENYILTQYFLNTPILSDTIKKQIDEVGLVYQIPYLEASPVYKRISNGFEKADLPQWLVDLFLHLSNKNLGIFKDPYSHQIKALESFIKGKNLLVSTGTGSGKTECFMWPILAKLFSEAKHSPKSWNQRGIRILLIYPMNALVSDQISRLRKMLGDSEQQFISEFHKECNGIRRPQFGMYTGRTPFSGKKATKAEVQKIAESYKSYMEWQETDPVLFKKLQKDGKLPAKYDLNSFYEALQKGKIESSPLDAELVTRFEMQSNCPDILISNYSMLEYMLMRTIEEPIWQNTKTWLNLSKENKLLIVLDEAHMYKGASGGEVAFLLRRLLRKLDIKSDKVQFILTTASMPSSSEKTDTKIKEFCSSLTGCNPESFVFLRGEQEALKSNHLKKIKWSELDSMEPNPDLEESISLEKIKNHFSSMTADIQNFNTPKEIKSWLYHHLTDYSEVIELLQSVRGQAISLSELASDIFPDEPAALSLSRIEKLIYLLQFAQKEDGTQLFPARLHLLFKGLNGVYACMNPNCSHSHHEDGIELGHIMLNDSHLTCPKCGSQVYRIYSHRNCGTLFIKGFIQEKNGVFPKKSYLWSEELVLEHENFREVYFYIPRKENDYPSGSKSNPILPCYLDYQSGFIEFDDDSVADNPKFRKLYYSTYSPTNNQSLSHFLRCPYCQKKLTESSLSGFEVRGNQPFFSLVRTQFLTQPPVSGKESLPNQGRKVLLFSDSRQQAAKLALEMSQLSDLAALRQLFARAVHRMNEEYPLPSLSEIYAYICLAATDESIDLFHGDERINFSSDVERTRKANRRRIKYGQKLQTASLDLSEAPKSIHEYILRFFCAGYNQFSDMAFSWLEPTEESLIQLDETLEELELGDEQFLEIFNCWLNDCFYRYSSLGPTFSAEVRNKVRNSYDHSGLPADWKLPALVLEKLNYSENDKRAHKLRTALHEVFLQADSNQKFFAKLTSVAPVIKKNHTWYKCKKCGTVNPLLIENSCPNCGSHHIKSMDDKDFELLSFLRDPVFESIAGKPISSFTTEEHTAQISHNGDYDAGFSKTEQYEIRFQDFVSESQIPVDILSCTTTMEVGIDIGSLVAVGLRNIPPLRDNYQQRAGRAGRRGASLSTIVTLCQGSPYDLMYFKDPAPMLRGDPRTPWIDVHAEKLIFRHLSIISFEEFLQILNYQQKLELSMDKLSIFDFMKDFYDRFILYLDNLPTNSLMSAIPQNEKIDLSKFKTTLVTRLNQLKDKIDQHPELFKSTNNYRMIDKTLFDCLYEEGIIPTYSFPVNVIDFFIEEGDGKVKYKPQRGIDVAINEYAPGRKLVIDKESYISGGLYYHAPNHRYSKEGPAQKYFRDPNYVKEIVKCNSCQWFGLEDETIQKCPFCGSEEIEHSRSMVRPWGFGPQSGRTIGYNHDSEMYSSAGIPIYSTIPDEKHIQKVEQFSHLRVANRKDQNIILINHGPGNKGFNICIDCGAAVPANAHDGLIKIGAPFLRKYKCNHSKTKIIDLGFDFKTDMVVLELNLDQSMVNINDRKWLRRAAASLSEAFRLAACKVLDIEFTELISGYRFRKVDNGLSIDLYLYDSLSSGAGYSSQAGDQIDQILDTIEQLLTNCTCDIACKKCLKHYQNQRLHSLMDRKSAHDLLIWAKNETIPPAMTHEKVLKAFESLSTQLTREGVHFSYEKNSLELIKGPQKKKVLIIHPLKQKQNDEPDSIVLTDSELNWFKPLALDTILEHFKKTNL